MDIKIDQILFQILNFAILLIVFKKLVYAPILKMLDSRASKIKDGLEAAEKNIKIQESMETEKQEQIAKAKKQASKIIADAKKEADVIIKSANEKARENAKESLAREKQTLEAQITKEYEDFKSKMASIITQGVNAVLRNSLDAKLQEEVVEKQIKGLKSEMFV